MPCWPQTQTRTLLFSVGAALYSRSAATGFELHYSAYSTVNQLPLPALPEDLCIQIGGWWEKEVDGETP
jgi:hypothetical protein